MKTITEFALKENLMKLNKKDLRNREIYLSPSYISNMHWMVALSCVENRDLFKTPDLVEAFTKVTSVQEKTDEFMTKRLPKKKNVKVKSAGRILNSTFDLDPREDRVVFANSKGETYFSRDYVKLLGVADVELYGDSYKGPFVNEDETVVLMPIKK